MAKYFELDNSSILFMAVMIMLILTILAAYKSYKYDHKNSMYLLMSGNLFRVVFYLILFVNTFRIHYKWMVLVNVLDVLSVTLYVSALLVAVNHLQNRWIYYSINAINIVLSFYFYYIYVDTSLRRITVAIAIIALLVYGFYHLKETIQEKRLNAYLLLQIIFGTFIVFQLYKIYIRLSEPALTLTDTSSQGAQSVILIGTLLLIMTYNYALVLLNMDFLNYQIQALANIDALTGIYNRGFFVEFLEKHLKSMKRSHATFVMAILDLDDFKRINDRYGHAVGDEVLKTFVEFVEENIRVTDVFGRYGGEEFVIFLLAEDLEGGLIVLNRLIDHISNLKFSVPELKLTFSGGASFYDDLLETPSIISIFSDIDKKLYQAKDQGKNQLVYE